MREDLAGRIKRLRRERGLRQRDLGDLIGVAGATVCMWETGQREPDASMLDKLADLFGVSLDFLLGRTDDRSPFPPVASAKLAQYPALREALERNRSGPVADLAALPEIMRASGFSEDDIATVMKIVKAFQPTRDGRNDK